MKEDTVKILIDLNHQFYQTFAHQFSATRQRIQPGVRQILQRLPSHARILDLGCGNGELWRSLGRQGFEGLYVGLDFSSGLLEEASQATETSPAQAFFIQADFSNPDWAKSTPVRDFDFILAFAVLHHLPGDELRRAMLGSIHDLLSPQGQFIHSEWQFMNSPRLAQRVQDWQILGLSPGQLDSGDYLMDWREGGRALRYVHLFTEIELELLAEHSGFRVSESFLSDGEGNRLGLYQVWLPGETTKANTR